MQRFLILCAGLIGAAGVALLAVAAHAGGENLRTAAPFLLAHAPALLALGLLDAGRLARLGGVLILAGVALFCGDLILRDLVGTRLFPMAAPTGGTTTILGWLVVAASALARQGE